MTTECKTLTPEELNLVIGKMLNGNKEAHARYKTIIEATWKAGNYGQYWYLRYLKESMRANMLEAKLNNK